MSGNNPGTAVSPLGHQDFTGMPNLGIPLVKADGTINVAWYMFFEVLWHKNCHDCANQITLNSVTAGANQDVNAERLRAEGAEQTETAQRQAADSALQAAVAALQARVDNATVGTVGATATAGTGGVLPAQVTGYLDLAIGATHYRVPLYLP